MRLALITLVAALAIAAPSAAKAASPLDLRPLHAEPDAQRGGRIVDDRGRQVLLRGVNVNALAEYWKGTTFPTVFPLDRKDPDRLAGIGWNAVRLLLSWSRVEPQPGTYDDAYLKQVAAVVERLRARGIYSIIDLHQDAWGATLVAPQGAICAPGSQPALGWDGAPGWATLDGGLPRCATGGIREASPAVHQAWSAFLGDQKGPGGVGIQARYVAMLGEVASRFARSPAVAGYDLMNEPNAFGPVEEASLSAFYGRALAAVRAGEKRAGGPRHLVLFEPGALWSALGRGAPPDFKRDRDVVYAPHIYTGGFDGKPITREAFQPARDEAKGFGGAPVLSGEWGGDPGRAGAKGDGYFLDHQRLQDEFGFSATLWTWRESCGDPHKAGDLRAGRMPGVWGEFEVSCKDNVVRGRRALYGELTRGYVRAAPGRLERSSYDAGAKLLQAAGTSPRGAGELVAFYPGTPKVKVSGLGALRLVRTPGGGTLVVAAPRGGAWTVSARAARK